LGNTLKRHGKLPEAMASFNRALEINPDFVEALNNLAGSYKDLGNYEKALMHYKEAIRNKPDFGEALAMKQHLEALMCDWSDYEESLDVISSLGFSGLEADPFAMLTLEDSPGRHRLRASRYASNKYQYLPLQFDVGLSSASRRLRVGYFSPDFHDHPVMHLLIGIFERHDRDDFEIYAYSYGRGKDDDDMRRRIIGSVDHFRDISEMDDSDAANLSHRDGIDIAVDLAGYTKNNRTGIFAYRAAPIQVNYLGYPGTMGADFMDYIVMDKVLVPDEYREHYSEKVIYMPNCYMATDNLRAISDRVMTRSSMGLPEDGFVFCVFNNSYKISPREFGIWMRLLQRIEGSVLWLRRANKWCEENLYREAQARGIDSSRLIFADRIPLTEHLARHRLADLFLDTFTYNAHSTAVDALWSGLPVLTRMGAGFAARVGGSLLHSLGLSELVTTTDEDYEALALSLASDPDRLSVIREKLADNRLTAPLFDTIQFTRHLEAGYREIRGRYVDGFEPDDIWLN
jgi:protein O-GlcNAc transferase